MSQADGVCWCAASDGKCPHNIQGKLPAQWNEMEKSIDDVLAGFDRRTIRKFLKRDMNGREKIASSSDKFKETYGPNLQQMVTKTVQDKSVHGRGNKEVVHPLSMARPGTAPEGTNIPAQNNNNKRKPKRKPLDPGMTKPLQLAEGEFVGSMTTNNMGFAHNRNNNMPGERPSTHGGGGSRSLQASKSTSALPRIPGAERLPDGQIGSKEGGLGNIGEEAYDRLDLEVAWGEAPANHMQTKQKQQTSNVIGETSGGGGVVSMPGENAVAMGLMRIADVLSRKILPWQACCCPRAVEQLRDFRLANIQGKHAIFVTRMKKQLEDKVVQFLAKKDEEVDFWMQKEIRVWMDAMHKQEADQTSFFQTDVQVSLSLSISLSLRFKGLYLYTFGISFHVEWYIRQLSCSSTILCSITSIQPNHHTDIYTLS